MKCSVYIAATADGFIARKDGGIDHSVVYQTGLMSEIIVTQMPILIGEGQPLFGETQKDERLSDPSVVVCPSGFVQLRYSVENEPAPNA